MRALQECNSIYDVREILAGFPAQIEDVYAQTWKRIVDLGSSNALLAKVVFLWVIHAQRSMTMPQLQQAVAASLDTQSYRLDPVRVIPEDTLLSLCRGLVLLDENMRLVRLVRESRFFS